MTTWLAVPLAFITTMAASDPLRVGVHVAGYPALFHDADGTLSGYDAEIIHEICNQIEDGCDLREMNINALFAAVDEGNVDMFIGGLGWSILRDVLFEVTCEYTPRQRQTGIFLGLPHFFGSSELPVAVVDGSLLHEELRVRGDTALVVDNWQDGIDALMGGDVDLFLDWPHRYRAADAGSTGTYRTNERLVLPVSGSVMGVRSGNFELRNFLDAVLVEMASDGRLSTHYQRWYQPDQYFPIALCDQIYLQS